MKIDGIKKQHFLIVGMADTREEIMEYDKIIKVVQVAWRFRNLTKRQTDKIAP